MDGPSVALVVFDLGGVLVRIVRSWDEAHARAGFPPHPTLASLAFKDGRSRLAYDHQVGRIGDDAFYDGVARISAGLYSADDVRRVHASWMYEQYPGVDRVFDAVARAGLPTAALSNTTPAHWDRLFPPGGSSREFPVLARIERPLASHLLGHAKPEPAIFEAFEARLGVPGRACIFFDDTRASIGAARERGWRAERIDPDGDTAEQMLRALRWHRLPVDG